MPSISRSAALVSARRRIARLLALGAAAALAVAFMPAAAVATSPTSAPSATTNGDWAQFRHDPAHSGYNAAETTISASNVAHLGVVWTGSADSSFFSPPAVANGVVYAGTGDGQLYAYAVGCASGGSTCSPLWTASNGGDGLYSPAVANGVVYVGSGVDNKLYAYDAAGVTGCNGTPKVCTPLWTATVGGLWITSAPSVADGVVYVGSQDGKLYAYDAAGSTGCSGTPKVCTPLWTSTAGTGWVESPAVANDVVYVGVGNVLHAYAVGCASGGGTCTPIWTATTGGVTSPAVANGVVYIGGWDSSGSVGKAKLYAYAVGCASGGGTCTPLWNATVGKYQPHSSPAVANGVVYVGSTDYDDTPSTYYNNKLFAFAVGCAAGGGTCSPLWTATTSGRIESSPAVANGVVYAGDQGGTLYAYAVGCAGGGGSCTPLWTSAGGYDSSPAVANGVLYVGEGVTLRAYAVLTPPSAPTGVSAVAGNVSAVVSWTSPSDSGGSPITAYTVTSSPASSGCSTAGLACTVTGLTNGQAYTFTVTATNGNGTGPASSPPAPATPYAISTYHALTPTRVLDSRDGYWIGLAGAFDSHVARTFQVANVGGVPANATAVTGNLTVTSQTAAGFLYIGPNAMDKPTSSTLNFPVGDDRANAVTVALGVGGTLSVTYAAPTVGATAQIIFDVTGYFTPDMSGATYHALTPARVLDSRDGYAIGLSGAFSSHVARTFAVAGHGGVPANATAVTGNLTVTSQTAAGFLYVGPVAMNNPTSSTLNFPVGDDRANAVTVALGAGGSLSATYAAPTVGQTAQVIFDVTGYFTPDASGATYHTLTPARVLDSRDGYWIGLAGAFSSHVARTFTVIGHGGVPGNATAVTGNLTVTEQTALGFLYIGPSPMNNPTSSTLNFPVGDDRANAVTVALGAGGTLSPTYAASTSGPTAQVIFDVTGYFTP